MPPITRGFIKASLIYFVAALISGLLFTANSVWRFSAYAGGLGPVYFHLFMVGWITQLIIGVALWMFPKYTQQAPRRSDRLSWIVFWLINTGLAIRTLFEPLNSLQPGQTWGYLVALSAILQWAAGIGFVINIWPRVKEK